MPTGLYRDLKTEFIKILPVCNEPQTSVPGGTFQNEEHPLHKIIKYVTPQIITYNS